MAQRAGARDSHKHDSVLDRIFRDPDTGKLTVVQLPNLPLAIFLVATLGRIAFHPSGTAATAVSVVGTVALGWWSVGEIGWGDSLFRRVLGGVVLAGLVARLVLR